MGERIFREGEREGFLESGGIKDSLETDVLEREKEREMLIREREQTRQETRQESREILLRGRGQLLQKYSLEIGDSY